MSKRALEHVLERSLRDANARAKEKVETVAAAAANAFQPKKDIGPILVEGKRDSSNLKQARDIFKSVSEFLAASKFSKFSKNTSQDELEKAKKLIVSSIVSATQDNKEETVQVSLDLLNGANSISAIAGLTYNLGRAKTGKANPEAVKRLLNAAIAPVFSELLYNSLDKVSNDLLRALELLLGTLEPNPTKDSEKALRTLSKLLQDPSGIENTKKAQELVTKIKDAKESIELIHSNVPVVVDRQFALSDKDTRDAIRYGSHVIDLKRLDSIILKDLALAAKHANKDTNVAKASEVLLREGRSSDQSGRTDPVPSSDLQAFLELVKDVSRTILDSLVAKYSKVICGPLDSSKTVYCFSNIKHFDGLKIHQLFQYHHGQDRSEFIYKDINRAVKNATDSFNIFDNIAATYTKDLNTQFVTAITHRVQEIQKKPNLTGRGSLNIKLGSKSIDISDSLIMALSGAIIKLGSGVSISRVLFDPGHINSVKLSEVIAYPIRRALAFARESPANKKDVDALLDILGNKGANLTASKFNEYIRKKLPDALKSDIMDKLSHEFITGEVEFSRILNDTEARAVLVQKYNVVSDEAAKVGAPELPGLMKVIQAFCFQATGVMPELSITNQWNGSAVQKHLETAKNAYMSILLDEINEEIKTLENKQRSNIEEERLENLRGSPSLKDLMVTKLYQLFTKGKSESTKKVTSKAVSKRKGRKILKTVKSVSKMSYRNSSTISKTSIKRLKSTIKIPRLVIPKSKVSTKDISNKSTKAVSNLKVTDTQGQTRLRSASGNVTSVTNIQNLLNLNLFDTIRRNMYSPRLNFKTGRFAKSAEIKSITHGKDDVIDIRYTYMRNPYGTFEPGGKQGSPSRDPKALISGSIRQVLQGQVLQRLRITRV